MAWQWGCAYEVNLRVQGNSLVATINGQRATRLPKIQLDFIVLAELRSSQKSGALVAITSKSILYNRNEPEEISRYISFEARHQYYRLDAKMGRLAVLPS
jgi:hypothetical protein